MYIKVEWPSTVATHVEVWRLLDLSGMVKSVRDARNFTKAGFLYVNGRCITSLKFTIKIGSPALFELRFPNGVIRSQEIMAVNRPDGPRRPRGTGTTTLYRRG